MARALGVEQYGLLQYTLGLVAAFSSISFICGAEVLVPPLVTATPAERKRLLGNAFVLRQAASVVAYICLLIFAWVAEDMGNKSGVTDNPLPVPINESNKVYRYQKSNAFYTNLFYIAPTYVFDLAKQNKIRLKVFIPSYNDYTTENGVAGEWIANKLLKPQLAVKLQNSSLGGNAWQSQTEIIKGDLQKDKWITLEFDFSGVADRKDYDKIVIQFGAEGQSGTGLFFFDDFTFSE